MNEYIDLIQCSLDPHWKAKAHGPTSVNFPDKTAVDIGTMFLQQVDVIIMVQHK